MKMKKLTLLLLSAFGLCNCHSNNVSYEVLAHLNDFINEDKVDALVLEYNDGSLPDDMRRGYSIHVFEDTVKVRIWSWHSKDVDIRKAYAVPGALRQLLKELKPLNVRKVKDTEPPRPGAPGDGGSGNDLRAYDKDDHCVFYADTYVCDDESLMDSGSIVEGFFQQCVPEDVPKMVNATRKGNSDRDGDEWQQITKVVYRYSDPTIAPQFYRTYTVTVTEDSIDLVVRNYSETLLTKQLPLTEGEYGSFITRLKEAGVKKVREMKSVATGGDSESLMLFKGDEEFFNAYQTSDGGNMRANVSLEALFNALVPGLDDIIESTRKNH